MGPKVTVLTTSGGSLEGFQSKFIDQLPLDSIKWQCTHTKRSHRIPPLHVDLIPFDAAKLRELVPSFDYEHPLVHIALVFGEDSNQYKLQVKDELTQWQARLAPLLCGQNWLIVHITSKAKGKGLKSLHLFDTLFDKLKNDFGRGSTDRIVQLPDTISSDASTTAELWPAFMLRLSSELVIAFDERVSYFETQIRVALESSTLKGNDPRDTDFCSFFLLKDLYGLSLESMNLKKEALEQYDELERVFDLYLDKSTRPEENASPSLSAVMDDKGQWLRWFGGSCKTNCTNGALLNVDIDVKNFRNQIKHRRVLIFEMRMYVLNKQVQLLLWHKQPALAAHRVLRMLQQVIIPQMRTKWLAAKPSFVCQWVTITCISVIRYTETFILGLTKGLGTRSRLQYALARASLCVCAKERLEELGIMYNYIPPPTTSFLAECEENVRVTPEPFSSVTPQPNTNHMEDADDVHLVMFPSLQISESQSNRATVEKTPLQQQSTKQNRKTRGVDINIAFATLLREEPTKTIKHALTQATKFDELYLSLCQSAIDSYKQAKRQRSSLSIVCDMASLYFHRQQFDSAADRFALAARNFRADGWFVLEVRYLQPLLLCYREVGRFEQYTSTCLRMISEDCPIAADDKRHYFKCFNNCNAVDINEISRFFTVEDIPTSVACPMDSIVTLESISVGERDTESTTRSPHVKITLVNTTAFPLSFSEVVLTFEEQTESSTAEPPPRSPKAKHNVVFPQIDLTSPVKSHKFARLGSTPVVSGYQDLTLLPVDTDESAVETSTEYEDAVVDEEVNDMADVDTPRLSVPTLSVGGSGNRNHDDVRTVVYRLAITETTPVVLKPGRPTPLTLVTDGLSDGALFAARKLELNMGRVTLVNGNLPKCHLATLYNTPFNLNVEILPREPDRLLLVNTIERVTIDVSLSREYEENTLRVMTDTGLVIKCVEDNYDDDDDDDDDCGDNNDNNDVDDDDDGDNNGNGNNKNTNENCNDNNNNGNSNDNISVGDSNDNTNNISNNNNNNAKDAEKKLSYARALITHKNADTGTSEQGQLEWLERRIKPGKDSVQFSMEVLHPYDHPLELSAMSKSIRFQVVSHGNGGVYKTPIITSKINFNMPVLATHAVTTTLHGIYVRTVLTNALHVPISLMSSTLVPNSPQASDASTKNTKNKTNKKNGTLSKSFESLNDDIDWPIHLKPLQQMALMWRVEPVDGGKISIYEQSSFDALVYQCTLQLFFQICSNGTDLHVDKHRFDYAMMFEAARLQFSCDMVPSSNACVQPVVGQLADFEVVVKCAGIGVCEITLDPPKTPLQKTPTNSGNDNKHETKTEDDNAIPIFSYAVMTDQKTWMASGKVRGIVDLTNSNKLEYRHNVLLLPLVPGFLKLPRVKLCLQGSSDEDFREISSLDMSSAQQVRVLPGHSISTMSRLALF